MRSSQVHAPYPTMKPAVPQVLRQRFEEKQAWIVKLHNSAGRSVVIKTPPDRALLSACRSERAIEALAMIYTRPIN
jgi:hypothetical protein